MKKVVKGVFYLILLLFILLFSLIVFSSSWAIDNFEFLSFDEILFQLTTPLENTASSIMESFINNSLLPAFVLAFMTFVVIVILIRVLKCKRFNFQCRLFDKTIKFNISSCVIKVFLFGVQIIVFSVVSYKCLDKVTFIDYVRAQNEESSFIEDNYVDPKKIEIKFPDDKRNLIYIYAESLESTFFSSELGGGSNDSYLAPLTEITSDNINFSDSSKFGGAMSTTGTTWTSGALVSYSTGLPLKISASLLNQKSFSSLLKNAYTISNILDDNGYNQMFMFGSDKSFGSRGSFFEGHGNVKIYDYFDAIKDEKIDKDYYEWWGFEDSKLFEYSKEEITRLSKSSQPFSFSLLTTNTHAEDGYLEEGCPSMFEKDYGNAIYCSATQIKSFIEWIQEQDFYENTTIIVVGDHVSMQKEFYPSETERHIYNLIINSAVTEGNFENRKFSSMDFFPTTLVSIGADIEGNRLGLGTNLFSKEKTLIEKVGYKTFDKEISKYSSFYMNEFVY